VGTKNVGEIAKKRDAYFSIQPVPVCAAPSPIDRVALFASPRLDFDIHGYSASTAAFLSKK